MLGLHLRYLHNQRGDAGSTECQLVLAVLFGVAQTCCALIEQRGGDEGSWFLLASWVHPADLERYRPWVGRCSCHLRKKLYRTIWDEVD